MKRRGFTAVLLGIIVSSHAQGTIVINNRLAGQLLAPIYGPIPGAEMEQRTGNTPVGIPAGTQSYGVAPLLSGTGFTFALFGGPSDGSLQFVGQTTFRTGAGAGFTIAGSPTVMIPGVPAGQAARLQVRVWDNQGGTLATWEQAIGRTSAGQGPIFTSLPLGDADGGSAIFLTPAGLFGMTSFNIMPIPEPSTVALAILGGLGALGTVAPSQMALRAGFSLTIGARFDERG